MEVFVMVFIYVACVLFAVLIGKWNEQQRLDNLNKEKFNTETDSVEDSPSAVTPAPSRTTIPGAQRIDTTPMTDRQLWEQIEYNTRMSADVLHRMWVVVVISMVLSVIGGIAMAALQQRVGNKI